MRRRTLNERGNRAETVFLDADGKPVLHRNRYAKIVFADDDRGNTVGEAYFGIDGKPTLHKDGYAGLRRTFDDHNRLIAVDFPCSTASHPTSAPTISQMLDTLQYETITL